MTVARMAPLAVVLLLGACVNVEEQRESDARDLGADFEHRMGYQLPPWSQAPEDGALSDGVRALLAGVLTEEAAVKIALLNNRDVRSAYERLGIARAELIQAGLLSNPVFDANAKFFRGGTEVELGLAQSFLDLFYIPLRKQAAKHELEAAKACVTRNLLHLAFEVRRAFIDVRASMQLVELQEQVLRALSASHELMAKLHAAGNVTDPQLTAERAAVSRARLDLATAQQTARESREPLSVLMGLWGSATGWKVEGRLAEELVSLDLEHVETRAIQASLELAENRAHANAAAQAAGLVSWEAVLSDGTLGALAKKEAGDGWGLGPGVALRLPVFDQGQARVAAAEARVREGLQRHVQIAVEVRSAARMLRDRLIMLSDRVNFLRMEHLPVRSRLVRETLQNYNAMQIGVFAVLMAKQQEIEAGREYLETLRAAWLARWDLEEILAGSVHREALAQTWPSAEHSDAATARGH